MIAVFKGLKRLFAKHSHTQPARNEQSDWKKLSADERLACMVDKGLKILLENGEGGHMVTFTVPKTDHEAQLTLSRKPRIGGDFWLLSVGVVRKGDDRLHSHYLCSGRGSEGEKEVFAYLTRPELAVEVVASVKELSSHIERDD